MITRLRHNLRNLLVVDPQNHRYLLIRIFHLVGLPLVAAFMLYDFSRQAYLEGVVTALVLAFFVFSFPALKRPENHQLVYRSASLILILNFSLVIYRDPDFTTSFLWMLILPLIQAFLFGTREGARWILAGYLGLVLASVLSPHRALIPIKFFLRFSIIYFLLAILAMIAEAVRSKVALLFIEKQNELEALNAQLYENSIRDALTGFYNRSFLADPLEKILAQARRTQQPLAVILIDLDNFKAINDHCGHLAGDQALMEISKQIRATLKRKSDIVIRYGGDEFLIVLPDTGLEEAIEFADKIRKQITNLKLSDCHYPVKASLGLTELLTLLGKQPLHGKDMMNALISAADQQLYRAKAAGGNVVLPKRNQ